MIKVTHNEQGQIITTCDTIDEHGILAFCAMMTICSGDTMLVSCMINIISTLPEEKAIEAMEVFPYSKNQLPLKEFFISLVKEINNPKSPLSKKAENPTPNIMPVGLTEIFGMNQPACNKLLWTNSHQNSRYLVTRSNETQWKLHKHSHTKHKVA